MPCRILCLHGMGINSQIFASQTESFRSLLPSDYDFTFVDGPTVCKPEVAIAKVYPGPYLCWYRTPTTESVTAAHHHVKSIMGEKGPFDGIMGFSQLENPSAPPLFKFAILIGSPLPFSHSLMYGIDTRDYFGVSCNMDCSVLARYNRPNKVPTYLITPDRYLKDDDDEDFDRIEEACQQPTAAIFYQMFHSTSDEVRMDIPTVHIFGRRDPWYLHSKDVLQLACPQRASVLEHCYGHEVPRHLSEEICDLIESAVALVEV
ncbi:hypothetical protein CSIM01_12525 [Colletotrichum simmondsii]|uniref:Serine hydrolase domain-containing protein n=1 Tax=Colletotrichum simmondsii TaxID=703756 RepID=A0A135RQ98_9PEZI|nr:hypothetical protein CSIM01_12525 [Colletotrichum simmondsii]